jgi:hypothetical protein
VISGVEPSPAFRGETLVIHGERLAGVRSVVLGGVPQSIAFVDADRVEVTLSPMTPLGAEPLFVSGNTASEALMVTVLDPLPVAESGPEASDGAEVIVAEGGAELQIPGGGGGGCGGGESPQVALGLVVVLGLVARRRGPSPVVRGAAGQGS